MPGGWKKKALQLPGRVLLNRQGAKCAKMDNPEELRQLTTNN